MKRIFVMSLLSIILLTTYVSAHDLSQIFYLDGEKQSNGKYDIGNEEIGWVVSESHHTNGNVTSYIFDDNVSSYFRNVVTLGTDMWSDVVTFYGSDGPMEQQKEALNTWMMPLLLWLQW